MEDPRIVNLRALITEAIQMRDIAERLIADLTEQLRLSVSTADDAAEQPERRKEPRT